MGLSQVELLTADYSQDDVSELVAVTGSTRLSSPAAVLRWGKVSPADLEQWIRNSWIDNLKHEFQTGRISSIRGEDKLPAVPLAEHLIVRDLDRNCPNADQPRSSHSEIVGHAHYRFWPSYGAPKEFQKSEDDSKEVSISIPPGFCQGLSDRIKSAVDATMLRLFKGLPCFELENISTLTPSHLRRGIAKSLTEWVFPYADKLALPVILSASPMGLPLYKKCGFVEYHEHDVVVELAEWGGEGSHRLVAMIRWPRQIQRLPESWKEWRLSHMAQ